MKHTDSLIVTAGAEKSTPKNKMMTQKRGVGVMIDKERREDDALKNLIQAAYDFSDDELLADLEEVEATLSDSDFPGIEERMYRKMMAKLAEEEVKKQTLENSEENFTDKSEEMSETAEVSKHSEMITEIPPVAVTTENGGKVVRFGKKKVVVVGILAAAFVGMLGVTAIGGKNYFFRGNEIEIGVTIDNDKNLHYPGSLEDAYTQIEEELNIQPLKMVYIPDGMQLILLDIKEDRAVLAFDYSGKIIHFVQERMYDEASVGINSDRSALDESIYNKWISKEFEIEEEKLDDGVSGYAATLTVESSRYRIIGQLEKQEFIKIIESLSF